MRAIGRPSTVCIRNVSDGGLLISCETPPPRGTIVEICPHGMSIVGEVCWTAEHRFGLVSRDAIDVDALVAGRSPRPIHSEPGGLRRSDPPLAMCQDRSRHTGNTFQSVVLIASGALAAVGLTQIVYDGLSAPFAAVEQALDGPLGPPPPVRP